MSFDGMRVLSFESRRAAEMAELIRRQRGDPFVAPSMREAPLADNEEAFRFAEKLFSGAFEMMILLTGVGTRALHKLVATRYPEERLAEALRQMPVVARGPKPAAVLREWGVPIAAIAPEPNTWREVLSVIEGRPERRVAVQEYGKTNTELLSALRSRGCEVTPVRVYQWALPDDTAPLREAARKLAGGQIDVAMFTTSMQLSHLLRVAAEAGIEEAVGEALRRIVIASIGPTTSEALEEYGIAPDLMPSHPKMGFLVKETAEQARSILDRKNGHAQKTD